MNRIIRHSKMGIAGSVQFFAGIFLVTQPLIGQNARLSKKLTRKSTSNPYDGMIQTSPTQFGPIPDYERICPVH